MYHMSSWSVYEWLCYSIYSNLDMNTLRLIDVSIDNTNHT